MYRETPVWPGDCDHAVMITLNVDGEYAVRMFHQEIDPDQSTSDGYSYEPEGSVGVRRNLDRILDVLEKYDIKATAFVPGRIAEKYPAEIHAMAEKGHEIAVRGYAGENLGLMPPAAQKRIIQKSVNIIKNVCGRDPVGFRAFDGEITEETLKAAEECGLKYSSTLADDDRPYRHKTSFGYKGMIEIPVHWALYDFPYFAFHFWPPVPLGQDRISCFKKVLENWKWEYDGFSRDGLCYVLQINPLTMGDPGKIYILDSILEYIKKSPYHSWLARGCDILDYCEGRI